MIDGKIGYAVLGLGIGMAHAEAAHLSENAVLCAVCDIDKKRLDEAHSMYPDATLYNNFDRLLNDGRVDIISICLPSSMHAEYAVRAMMAGKHVLIEKPVDITPERAEFIMIAEHQTKMTAGVVHQNRFNLNMYPIKQAIDSGSMGKLFLGTFAVKWYREQSYYDRGGWRGTWEYDGGGSLINQAVHTVDLMRWLMGEPVSVTAHAGIVNHKIDTEDFTASLIKFESGAVATFVSTTCAYPGISTEISLYGTDGTIEADGDAIKLWKMRNSVNEEKEEESILKRYGNGNLSASVYEPEKLYGHRFVVEDMILAVRDKRAPKVTVKDAVDSLKIVDMIYRAAKLR